MVGLSSGVHKPIKQARSADSRVNCLSAHLSTTLEPRVNADVDWHRDSVCSSAAIDGVAGWGSREIIHFCSRLT